MFRAIISPILRSTRLCLQLLRCIICKQSLVLLRMGEIIARNMLSWLKLLINCYCWIWLVVLYHIRHNIFQVSFCFTCYIHGNGINSAVAPP